MYWQGLVALAVFAVAQSVSEPHRAVPDFRDLSIKTRRTYGEMSAPAMTEIVWLKGARERREQIIQRPDLGEADHTIITINQCDRQQVVYMNGNTKLYGAAPLEDWPGHVKRLRSIRQPEPTGADVEITIDSVDTGERRRVGSYIARRVTMTRTVAPSPGANTRASTEQRDGWYIDLPGLGCAFSRTDATLLDGRSRQPRAATRPSALQAAQISPSRLCNPGNRPSDGRGQDQSCPGRTPRILRSAARCRPLQCAFGLPGRPAARVWRIRPDPTRHTGQSSAHILGRVRAVGRPFSSMTYGRSLTSPV